MLREITDQLHYATKLATNFCKALTVLFASILNS